MQNGKFPGQCGGLGGTRRGTRDAWSQEGLGLAGLLGSPHSHSSGTEARHSELRGSLTLALRPWATPVGSTPAPAPRAGCSTASSWPSAHSCPLAFLLAPTPAISWGLKPQKAGVTLLSVPTS